MARIRSVKPETWADRALAGLTRDARLLYIGLWNFADEHGRLPGDPRYVKGHVFPYDDDLTALAVDGLLSELEAAGKVVRYQAAGDPYLFLPRLAKHQKLDPRVESRLPEPPASGGADTDEPEPASVPNTDPPRPVGDESVSNTDQPVSNTDEKSLLYVAGGRGQVAGGRVSCAAERRDETWDAVMAACGIDTAQVTKSARGGYNAAVAELKRLGATPAEIARRAGVYRASFTAVLTPTALAKQWAQCERRPPARASPRQAETDAMFERAMARAEAREAP